MINLLNKIINMVPFPTWIGARDRIININNYFSITFNEEISKLDILDHDIRLFVGDREIIISKEDNSRFIYKGKKYTHRVITEWINKEKIQVGMLLDEDYLSSIELENSTNILQTVMDNVPEIIFYKDKNGVYKGANKQCIEFYNSCGATELIGKTDLQLPLDRKFVETCARHDAIVMKTKKPLFIEEELVRDDKNREIFETIKTPVLNSNNEVWGIVGVVRDITTRKAEETKLRYLSYTDVLTGLYNRAFFDEKVEQLIENKNFPIGIIMGDINGLKLVNDTFGHIAGDNLITTTAKIIKNVCDGNEFIFRWGGDEFIVLIPKSSHNKCESLMKKIKIAMANSADEKVPLNISLGYSLIMDNESSIDRALKKAENMLYREKILTGKSIRSSILGTLQNTLQCKNVESAEHTERVLNYCIKIAEGLNLNQDTIHELIILARLHDIGKIAVPEHILLKESKLTRDEYEIMKTHTEKGYRLAMTLPEISHVARGILTHHERWDGKGYPLGIAGEEIPFIARIVSIVDAYDTILTSGYNKKKITRVEAIEEIKRGAGHQFDPRIAEVFCNILKEELQ